MRDLFLTLLLFAVPAVFAASPPSAEEARMARELEKELDVLGERLRDMNEDAVRRTIAECGIAATMDKFDPGNPKTAAINAKLRRIWDGYHRAMIPLAVRTTVIAQRLKTFRETGALPPPPGEKELAALAREIDRPTTARPELSRLALDLPTLMRQLRLKPPPEAEPAAKERSSTPAPLPSRAPSPRTRPEYQADAGTGRPEVDPVPDLIRQLSEPQPSRRALAADQLGQRGTAARRAAQALRRALSDPDARVRASAALALGGAGDASDVPDLKRALQDKDEDVRFSARAALRLLSERPVGNR